MKPNIIIVISDALRPKDLSLYGSDKSLDGNLREIASESLVFEKNFSASNASDPSVTSIFSGQYPTVSGFVHQHPFTKDDEIKKLSKNKFWLPIYLKNNGYFTFSATPLHLWFKKGFDYYMERDNLKGKKGFLNSAIIKKVLLNLPYGGYKFGKKLFKTRASPHFYSAKEVMDLSISKINESTSPFFLFMHLTDTHYPYASVENKKVENKKTLGEIIKNLKYPLQKDYLKKRFYDISADSMDEIEHKKDESIKYVDVQVNRLVLFLKERKIWENTIFIFLSDHGDNFGEHSNYLCRGGLYDSSIQTPLIIHLPGIEPKRFNGITSTVDIAPTIADFLNNEKINTSGKSLIPLIKQKKIAKREIISVDGFCDNRIATRTLTKKTIVSTKGNCYICGAIHGTEKEIYDLKNDPEEINNLATE